MFGLPSLFRRHPTAIEVIAGLRDQIIELGTHVRFLEADKRDPQPRDEAGRYVSKVEITRQRLARLVSRLTPEEAQSARMRGMGGGR